MTFCLFQYIDPDTDTYYSYLGESILERYPDGTEKFVCIEPDRLYRGWHLAARFNAINPIPSHPIQNGMKLYCVEQNIKFPYNSTKIRIEYDPFNTNSDSVYFIAYNQRVPFSIPLYAYTFGDDNLFISFDNNPPTDDPGWKQADVSPVFVISGSTFNGYKSKDIPFKCINERCVPWAYNIRNIYDNIPDNQTYPFDQCILLCSGLGLVNEGSPTNLIQNIQNAGKKASPARYLKRTSPGVLGILMTFFIVFLGLILVKNKTDTNRKLSRK